MSARRSDGAWIFAYGSLVSPRSLTSTIGRAVDPATEMHLAHVHGYGRRWNYGSMNMRGDWHHDGVDVTEGVVISLGLQAVADEVCNGVVVHITSEELVALDWRERDYERTDVSDLTAVDARIDGPVHAYVPRPSAVERYQAAREAGRAAIRQTYWNLVREAFGTLGDHHLIRYDATPAPDVPVVDIDLASPWKEQEQQQQRERR